MSTAIDKLKKILTLEYNKQCRDAAVMGGLESFIQNWSKEAHGQATNAKAHSAIDDIVNFFSDYSAQSVTARQSSVKRALAKLGVNMEQNRDTPPRETGRRTRKRSMPVLDWHEPIEELGGVGKRFADKLKKLGLYTIRDLLYWFPFRYDDFSSLKPISHLVYGEEVTIVGVIHKTHTRDARSGMKITTSTIADGTGYITATWFNQPYLQKQLRPGKRIAVSGKVNQYLGKLTFQSPVWEPIDRELQSNLHTGRLVPVYSLTKGLSSRWLRKTTRKAIERTSGKIDDHLPTELRRDHNLLPLNRAIEEIHFPSSPEMRDRARRRLAFDEFLLIQLGVLRQRNQWKAKTGHAVKIDQELLERFIASLPFELTGAQKRALSSILDELKRDAPMSRLLQGDVGAGKTVVAAAAALMVVNSGFQAALMAPTEILAEQHYQTLSKLLGDQKQIELRLLTGGLPAREKQEVQEEIASGKVNFVVGTHALIQKDVNFPNLGLSIVDEQHRFGVKQRAALRQQDPSGAQFYPHLLVMSATPIPRSLALTIYGDLDLSVIDEMPPGRQTIQTRWLAPRERERAYQFIKSQIEQGRQAFIICPLVEESEKIESKAAVEEHQRLQHEIFPDLKLGLLHGRMKSEEKEAVMAQFKRGELDILVSTAVVEVGIDVPNATVMLIESANRFGLAQLHQFRGRVGRGEHQSYCLLLADAVTETSEQRLKVIAETQDGFRLAEEDLKLRGPGDFFGTRQSGLPELRMAGLGDTQILEEARSVAAAIFQQDPELNASEHALLAQKVEHFWQGEGDLS